MDGPAVPGRSEKGRKFICDLASVPIRFDLKMFHSGLFAVVIVVAMMTVVTPLPTVPVVLGCGII